MATVWQYLFHPTIGPLNALLALVGIPGPNWLGASDTVLYSLSIIGVWQSVGFNMVLFLAGLTAIPRELYAAAEVDGARSALDRFLLVTWPMLGPTTLFVATISVINAVKVFDTVKTLTEGGPNKASEVLLFTIYQEGFVYLRVGYASAMTVVFLGDPGRADAPAVPRARPAGALHMTHATSPVGRIIRLVAAVARRADHPVRPTSS